MESPATVELIRQRDVLWAAIAEIRSKVVMDLDVGFEDEASLWCEIHEITRTALDLAGLPLTLINVAAPAS